MCEASENYPILNENARSFQAFPCLPRILGSVFATQHADSCIQDDNEDFCSSCGGNGDLVCCDGCPRSFHLKCVDPPLQEGHLPDTWFCNVCIAKQGPPIKDGPGPFGKLQTLVQKKNSSAFSLPLYIREYFEDVRTGPEGEYEEGPVPPPASKAK